MKMKKRLVILLFGLCAVLSAQAQFAKPLKKKNASKGAFSIGITGSYAANDMLYSAVSSSALRPFHAPTFGLAAEWNTMHRWAVGLDVSYAIRGDNKAFSTEFLTSYSTTTFAHVTYNMSLRGVELRIPVLYYFGDSEHLQPYVYVSPRFSLWLDGQYRWERVYDNESFAPVVFEGEMTTAMVSPLDISAMAGLGVCGRLKAGRMRLFVKFDLGYGISVINNFSRGEINEEVVFQGWGDIEHETLGMRYLQNVEARLTLLVSLKKPADDACDFNQKPYKRR